MKTLLPWLLALVVASTSSCLAVAAAGVAGFGYLQYERNWEDREFEADFDLVWSACHEALEDLEYPSPSGRSLDAREGSLVHEEYAIRLERRVEEDRVLVRVRFGTFVSEKHRESAVAVLDRVGEILDQDEELRRWTEDVGDLTHRSSDGSEE